MRQKAIFWSNFLVCTWYYQSPENITVARSLTGGRFVKQWKFGGRFVKIEIWRKVWKNIFNNKNWRNLLEETVIGNEVSVHWQDMSNDLPNNSFLGLITGISTHFQYALQ